MNPFEKISRALQAHATRLNELKRQSEFVVEVAKTVREFVQGRNEKFPEGRARIVPAEIDDFAAGTDVSEKETSIDAGDDKYFFVERLRFVLVRTATAGDGVLGVPLPIALNESFKAGADTSNAKGFWWKFNFGTDGDAFYVNGSYDYLSSDMAVGGYDLPVPILLAPKQSMTIKAKPMVAGSAGDEYTMIVYGEGRSVTEAEYSAWKARKGA